MRTSGSDGSLEHDGQKLFQFPLCFLLLNKQDTKKWIQILNETVGSSSLALLTYEEDEAGPLVELHGVGLA